MLKTQYEETNFRRNWLNRLISSKKIVAEGGEVHLVGRDEENLKKLASELNSTFTVCDVLEESFADKIFNDLNDTPINGLAYCVGSIDLKPIKVTKKSDYMQSFNLNLGFLLQKLSGRQVII